MAVRSIDSIWLFDSWIICAVAWFSPRFHTHRDRNASPQLAEALLCDAAEHCPLRKINRIWFDAIFIFSFVLAFECLFSFAHFSKNCLHYAVTMQSRFKIFSFPFYAAQKRIPSISRVDHAPHGVDDTSLSGCSRFWVLFIEEAITKLATKVERQRCIFCSVIHTHSSSPTI